ncbi:MAG: HAMP domain-containing histidine kinase [Leptolyngbyaceae cyanobacterium SL_1_1]|nr:HAMP domain-containing histidine kinase [Leptolyngbyaceae cyanobacterium RM1_1_2]NJO09550.1 HAMP domain-containing histidine kinase [Leptolyngbyaceae cyanobacterium SL_1_1]
MALTKSFSNTLWPEYASFLQSSSMLSGDDLRSHAKTYQLQRDVLTQMKGLSVTKVKIFDLEGKVIFSTDLAQIGINQAGSKGFLSAKLGVVSSQLGHRDSFQAIQGELEDRDLFSSYVPVTSQSGSIIQGVVELYSDVTPLLQQIHETRRTILLGSFVILISLYSVLFLVIQRADQIIRQQHTALQKSQVDYKRQAQVLERALDNLQQAQTQLVHSEKMSGLGQMVAGIAHEINNPAGFIYGNLKYLTEQFGGLVSLIQLYQKHCSSPAPEITQLASEIEIEFLMNDLPRSLESMRVGTERIRQIVLSLRNFARLDRDGIDQFDLHQGLEDTLLILQNRLKPKASSPGIKVIKNYGDLPLIEAHGGQLNQVFMNLLNNAVDAIQENYSATLEEAKPDPRQILISTQAIAADYVRLQIQDGGTGMSEQTRTKVFDPFFTTKPVGKGTGLGLSISYQIITQNHQGQIRCDSVSGKGTTFTVTLPVRQASL